MLKVESLSHRFGEREVLSHITLELPRGRILALLGPNGAGKTTLLRLLCGILPISEGRITFDGSEVRETGRRSAWRGRVGLVTETPGLYEALAVRENLLLFARLQGLDAVTAAARVQRFAERFGLGERLDERCGTLSKGLKQRVALARALLHEPELLLLDEPTSGLDPEGAAQLRDWLHGLKAEGRTLVLATHDLAEALALADDVQVLNRRMCELPAAQPRWQLEVERAADWSAWLAARGWTASAQEQGRELLLEGRDDVPETLAALCAAGARVHAFAPAEDGMLARYRRALAQLAEVS
jgi:ABC-2 type transport system ATP-binding protein